MKHGLFLSTPFTNADNDLTGRELFSRLFIDRYGMNSVEQPPLRMP
ncbi:MAG: hypothetical protein H6R44_254 [Nitrospirae bacterium]|nr:hypothetical protein [Nitrospirota bacterium]MBS1242499.1 hypothetical protein [Nitrospirota bacterium]